MAGRATPGASGGGTGRQLAPVLIAIRPAGGSRGAGHSGEARAAVAKAEAVLAEAAAGVAADPVFPFEAHLALAETQLAAGEAAAAAAHAGTAAARFATLGQFHSAWMAASLQSGALRRARDLAGAQAAATQATQWLAEFRKFLPPDLEALYLSRPDVIESRRLLR